jgi:hypothetical protein
MSGYSCEVIESHSRPTRYVVGQPIDVVAEVKEVIQDGGGGEILYGVIVMYLSETDSQGDIAAVRIVPGKCTDNTLRGGEKVRVKGIIQKIPEGLGALILSCDDPGTKVERVSTILSDEKTQGLVAYTNVHLGFGFFYPEDWKVQEYYYDGKFRDVALDPNRVDSQQSWETMDAPMGLVQIMYSEDSCAPLSDEYRVLTRIGVDNILAEKRDHIETNSPNPSYEGMHTIEYRVNQPNQCGSIEIRYVSKPDDPYLAEFEKVVSTFSF